MKSCGRLRINPAMRWIDQISLITAVALCCLFGTACRRSVQNHEPGTVVITANLDPGAKTYELTEALAREFTAETGVQVRLIKGPADASERISQYLQFLGAKSPDIDVYQVDVIWPAMLAPHMLDLKDTFTTETAEFFPNLIENDTVDGKLVAIPWFADAGMLYYRSDLLQKYGFPLPPATWDDLTTMAARIQEGERKAGNRDFWGFVWQGRAYEGLTCNALEWQASSGGGHIVEAGGRVHVNNPAALRAFTRAAGWVGTISPRGITTYAEEESRQMFQSGNAAFLRNWPYVYSLANGDDSPIRGKFNVAPLPSGGHGHAAALGGWHLAVSKYSRNPREAAEFVRFLTSHKVQRQRALELSMLPTRVALYDDPEIAEKVPFLPTMKKVFMQAVPRPSTAAGEDYNEVSTYYYQHVHRILTSSAPPQEVLRELHNVLEEILQ